MMIAETNADIRNQANYWHEVCFLLLIIMIQGIFPHHNCVIHICLRWTLRKNMLKIICKIDDLHLPVSVRNNHGTEIARCNIPFPFSSCTSYYNNTSIQQNVKTNETIVKVTGRLDHRINGNWSCHHGIGRPYFEAYVEIFSCSLKGNKYPEENDKVRCLKEISINTVGGFAISVCTISICLMLIKCATFCKQGQYVNRKVSLFLKLIDTVFEVKRCGGPSVKNVKVVFYICFAYVVIIAGGLIVLFGHETCKGAAAFIVLGILLCVSLVILFYRSKADDNADKSGAEDAEQANTLLETYGEKGSNNEEENSVEYDGAKVNKVENEVVYKDAIGEGDEGQKSASEEVATVSDEAFAEVDKRTDNEVDEEQRSESDKACEQGANGAVE